MTDQHRTSDETQPHSTADADGPSDPLGSTAADDTATHDTATDSPAADRPATDRPAADSPATDREATDDTATHDTTVNDTATHASGGGLRADPSRPADNAWREPPWFPPKDPARERRSSPIAIVVGLVMIAVGLYFFVDRTLGVALPRIQWGTIWPVVLIVIGGLVLLRSVNRRT